EELNEEGGVDKAFEVFPTALYDNKLTKVAAYNPSTKHYLGKDIFTHIASIATSEADMEFAREQEDSLKYRPYLVRPELETVIYDTVAVRDTTVVRKYFIRLSEIVKEVKEHPDYTRQDGDIAVGLRLLLQDEKRDTTFVAEPISVLRGPYLYAYPVHVQDLALKLRVNEKLFLQLFPPETNLDYQPYRIKQGESFEFDGYSVQLTQISREVEHPLYIPQEGDIAVSAILKVQKDGATYQAAPVFLIRDNQYNNLKAEVPELGLHFRFSSLDPTSETMEILAAASEPISKEVPVDVAYAPRTDFLVLESIVFPGINFFWAGSILMMLGLLMGMFYRIARR
ncbi:MAG: cytochrome c assembly protein, partial [Phaeodactylibacter sp.]|nr:cytochrome c assembly protein [Phaeodactylibacter sp.]